MRIVRILVYFLVAILLSGCASLELQSGKSVFWASDAEVEKIAKSLGYAGLSRMSVDRDSAGDHLFLQFYDSSNNHKLIVISGKEMKVRDIPGRSVLDVQGNPICWYATGAKFDFANGYLLPTNTHAVDLDNYSDGKYLALRRSHRTWIAPVKSPTTELIPLPQGARPQVLVLHGDTLHIFYADAKTMVKYLEYDVTAVGTKLVRSREFEWVQRVHDYDPDSDLIVAESTGEIFSHPYLSNIQTGARKRVPAKSGQMLFLKDTVAKQYHRALENAVDTGSAKVSN